MDRLTYAGFIVLRDFGDSDDVLTLSTLEDPLTEILEPEISGMCVSVRYWVTEAECTKEQAKENFIRKVYNGTVAAEYAPRYSELTGYLWTDEELNVGGHDLLAEITSHKGKWIILEIDVA